MEPSRVPVVKITILPDRTQALFWRLLPFPVSSGMKVYLSARIYDIECYITEFIYVIIFASTFPVAGVYKCGLKGCRWGTFIDKTLLNPHPDSLVGHMPRLRGWSGFCAEKTQTSAKRVAGAVEEVKELRFPLFTRAPAEAVELYKTTRPQRPAILTSEDIIRIEYFSSLEKGKYRRSQEAKPDASMDLCVANYEGVDLSMARKAWGLESLAIITDGTEPFRVVFDLATEDRLSPIAAYDLSKQFTQPIRVFEPRVAKMTTASRAIRGITYPALFFIFTLVKLLVGFPEKNTEYLSILYGRTYTTAYECVGRGIVRLREVTLNMFELVLCLPFAVAYYAWLAAKKSALVTINVIARSLTATVNAIKTSLAFAFSLKWETWLIIMAICWYALAEYQGSRA